VLAGKIHRMIRESLGVSDPYLAEKKTFTKLILKMEPQLRSQIVQSTDPFDYALRLAIAGNIIDFGVKGDLTERDVIESIEHALQADIDPKVIQQFCREIDQARTILYLADNAGEIVFDKLFIEQLSSSKKVTVAVKESPIINDATFEEARESGLTDLANVKIISNGTDIPGTLLHQAPEEFMHLFRTADVVISKGQGNFEMLNESGRPIWFLLKVKCPVLSRYVGLPMGDMILLKQPNGESAKLHS
jgi:uncharacterized protein with ATP-grasp and redox domains